MRSIVFKISVRKLSTRFFSSKNRFGYGEDTSHYPFPGGVTHSDDLIYLFPDPPNVAELNEDDKKIAQLMVDLWTSFAISGVPKIPQNQNGTEVLQWQPFSGNLTAPTIFCWINRWFCKFSSWILGQSSAYLHINKELRIGEDYRQEFTVRVQEHQNKTKNWLRSQTQMVLNKN